MTITVGREVPENCPEGCGGCSCHIMAMAICSHCENGHNGGDQEISVDCFYTPAGEPVYSHSHGNHLPGKDAQFTWDSTSFLVDGRSATPEEIEELEGDEKLMLLFEQKARNDYY